MARTIEEIRAEIIAAKESELGLADLSSTSATSVWRLWVYVVAVAIWALEKIFDAHIAEVRGIIASEKPHTTRWYATMAKRFQLGFSLAIEQDYYNNTSYPEPIVASSKIIKQAAVTETANGLRVKVAKEESGSDLGPLTPAELDGFAAYMAQIKDAGVRLYISSTVPDQLKLSLTIYYDPLILSATGERLDGSDTAPVATAITNFLKALPFNGLYLNSRLVDALQAVQGVVNPHLVSAQARYGALSFAPVAVEYQPDAGYLRILPTDLTITYLPHEPV